MNKKIIVTFLILIFVFSSNSIENDSLIKNKINSLIIQRNKNISILKNTNLNKINDFKIEKIDKLYEKNIFIGYKVKLNTLSDEIFLDNNLNLVFWPYSYMNNNKIEKNKYMSSIIFKDATEKDVVFPIELKAYRFKYADLIEGYNFPEELNLDIIENFYCIDQNILNKVYKNQREGKKQIDYLNKINFTDRFKYLNDYFEPPYKCYFFALANTIDINMIIFKNWNIRRKKYINFLNGKKEYGTDPRYLELIYRYFAKKDNSYRLLSPFFYSDPITGESIPYAFKKALESLVRYDEIPETLYDNTVTLNTYRKKDYMYFANYNKINYLNLEELSFKEIKKIIETNGSLIGGILLREKNKLLRFISHAVSIIGVFEYNKNIYFIYKDNYGKEKEFKFLPSVYFKDVAYIDVK